MSKKRQKRLNSVLHLAESTETQAALEFVKAKDSFEFNQARLEELRTFRDEYRNEEKPISAHRLQSTRQFLSQLSHAIDQQESQVDQMLTHMRSEQDSWNATRLKRKSIEKLLQKRDAEFDKQEAKLEQKQLDELNRSSFRH